MILFTFWQLQRLYTATEEDVARQRQIAQQRHYEQKTQYGYSLIPDEYFAELVPDSEAMRKAPAGRRGRTESRGFGRTGRFGPLFLQPLRQGLVSHART